MKARLREKNTSKMFQTQKIGSPLMHSNGKHAALKRKLIKKPLKALREDLNFRPTRLTQVF